MIDFAAIYLWVIGQAEVTWSDTPDSGGAKSCFDYEIYMKECFALWGHGQGKTTLRRVDLNDCYIDESSIGLTPAFSLDDVAHFSSTLFSPAAPRPDMMVDRRINVRYNVARCCTTASEQKPRPLIADGDDMTWREYCPMNATRSCSRG